MKLTPDQIEFLKELDALCKKYSCGIYAPLDIYRKPGFEVTGWCRYNVSERKGTEWVGGSQQRTPIENFPEGVEL